MSAGQFKFLVDALVLFHMSFVIFVLFGGFLALWKRWAILAHLPCLAWGIHVELSHRLCPLTPLENQLRRSAGEAQYQGSFVDHYIMPVLYPHGLTQQMQVEIACVIIFLNGLAYGTLIYRAIRARRAARLAGANPVERSSLPDREHAEAAATPASGVPVSVD